MYISDQYICPLMAFCSERYVQIDWIFYSKLFMKLSSELKYTCNNMMIKNLTNKPLSYSGTVFQTNWFRPLEFNKNSFLFRKSSSSGSFELVPSISVIDCHMEHNIYSGSIYWHFHTNMICRKLFIWYKYKLRINIQLYCQKYLIFCDIL